MDNICSSCTEIYKIKGQNNAYIWDKTPKQTTRYRRNNIWEVKCECINNEIYSIETKNIQYIDIDTDWKDEQICPHIQIGMAAKIIGDPLSTENNEQIIWAKKQLGNNWESRAELILLTLKPQEMRDVWNDWYDYPGFSKINHIKYFNVEYKHNIWYCECAIFAFNIIKKNPMRQCEHISIAKRDQSLYQNRREMCIRLAQNYIENNIK
jgi:hypothetical protein